MGRSPQADFAAIEDALRRSGSLGEPAEIHGEYCGLACVMGADAGPAWAASILAQTKSAGSGVSDTLQSLAVATWDALDAGNMELSLLLPSDDESLEARAESLGYWCQGFMHGLGAASDERGADSPSLADGVTGEIIRDFSEITRAAFTSGETEHEAEAAYIELVEFVRVSAQLAFEELYRVRKTPRGAQHH